MTESWSAEATKAFCQHVVNKAVTLKVCETVDGCSHVRVQAGDEDVGGSLLAQRLAVRDYKQGRGPLLGMSGRQDCGRFSRFSILALGS